MSQINLNFSTNCVEIEQLLTDKIYLILMPIQIILLGFILILIIYLIIYFKKNKFYLHGNLMILFPNIIVLYFIQTIVWLFCLIRYKILLYTYRNPCDLLTPVWLVLSIYAPYFINTIAYPFFHFCIMIERARATLLAEKYEKEGRLLGIFMSLAVVSFLEVKKYLYFSK
ncbi:unnamed protein product [Meloidogyne enterolobii]|uniref:Uncharacterized protein n=1 Tax=Meloidogyne enterolobii TaxID=390850 RepID=A0ACB0YIQ7_MELEN